jgi:hypothetical protein
VFHKYNEITNFFSFALTLIVFKVFFRANFIFVPRLES